LDWLALLKSVIVFTEEAEDEPVALASNVRLRRLRESERVGDPEAVFVALGEIDADSVNAWLIVAV